MLLHPGIRPSLADDFTAEDWRPSMHELVVHLMPWNDAACFTLFPQTGAMWEVHAAVLPWARSHSVAYARDVIRWVRENTHCGAVIAYAYNLPSRALLRRVGFKRVGEIPASKKRGGRYIPQTLYALEI